MKQNQLVNRSRSSAPTEALALPVPFVADRGDPKDYIMDQGLEDAANTALQLGQPLLLTGEPGTGKTQFAHFLAWHLGLDAPFEFHTKSTSVATDLFYSYDAVRRFHVAHTGKDADEREFIRYNALGRAILRSLPVEQVDHLCRTKDGDLRAGPRRSVVLIDEIDKASRDFPNDLLNELSGMSFRIPELGTSVSANKAYRPIVIITSNQERPLPDAFLRRCVFYCIEPPDRERLIAILAKRFGGNAQQPEPLLASAVAMYSEARKGASRAPSVAELVGWFHLLTRSGASMGKRVADVHEDAVRAIAALAKTPAARTYLSELAKASR
jgi:MoxR-like ATPase